MSRFIVFQILKITNIYSKFNLFTPNTHTLIRDIWQRGSAVISIVVVGTRNRGRSVDLDLLCQLGPELEILH